MCIQYVYGTPTPPHAWTKVLHKFAGMHGTFKGPLFDVVFLYCHLDHGGVAIASRIVAILYVQSQSARSFWQGGTDCGDFVGIPPF